MLQKEAEIMDLLRKGKISQGRAAEMLEISRYDLFDLMEKYKIPVINMTLKELERELKQANEVFAKDCHSDKEDAINDSLMEDQKVLGDKDENNSR